MGQEELAEREEHWRALVLAPELLGQVEGASAMVGRNEVRCDPVDLT